MGDSTKIKRTPSSVPVLSRLQKLKQNVGRLDVKKEKEGNKIESSEVLEDFVTCGICLERLSDPRMLPCQHTFCLSCLHSHLVAEAGRAMNKRHTPPSPKEVFAAVEQEKVELKCPTCQNVCIISNGLAGLEELPKNLYIDSLLNLLKGEKDQTPITPTRLNMEFRCSKCQTRCQFEERKCQHCLQIFCKVCWTEHMLELKKNLVTLINQLSVTQEKLDSKVEDFEERCKKIETSIMTAAEEKIKEIRLAEQEALKKCNEYKQNEKNSAEHLKGKIEDVKNVIQEIDFDNIENDIQKVVTFVNFHRDTSTLIDEVDQWGELNFSIDSATLYPTATVESPKFEPLQTRKLDQCEYQYRSRSYTAKLIWNKCPRPAGVCVAPWASQLLYIATTDNKAVLIMDRVKFKVIGKLISEHMSCPHGIACNGTRGEIYVTDKWNHCIHVFSSTGDYIKAIGRKGVSEGKLVSPEGIAVCPNNNLVVCDPGNDKVAVLNPDDGHEVMSLGKVNKRTELESPLGVAVHKDKIIVADSGNYRVKIFSLDGEKLFEFGGKGVFQSLEAIACDPNGVILVGDSGDARLKIFTSEGHLIRTIGGPNSIKFSSISGITVSPDFDIIATDSKSRRLQIF